LVKVELMSREKNVEKYRISFDESEIKEEERKVIQRFKKNANIPGFRKGKVPESIIIARIGKDNIRYFVEDALISRAVREISEEKELVISPVVQSTEFKDDSLEILVDLHLEPKLEVPNYDGMEVELELNKKTIDEYVKTKLESLARENAVVKPKDGRIEYGDIAKIEYSVENKKGETIYKSRELEVEVLEDDKRPFITEIVGAKAGDTIEFIRTFEKNGEKREYKYIVNVKEVYQRIMPEINDEFVKNLEGDFQNLEELKESIRNELKDIERMKEDEIYRLYLMEFVFSKILNEVKFDVSDETVELMAEEIIENMKKKGNYKEFKETFEADEEVMEGIKKLVMIEFKESRFIDYVVEKENLKLEDEDFAMILDEIAEERGISREKASALLKSNSKFRNDVVENYVERRVKEILLNKVKLKIVEKEEENPNEGEEEKDEG